MNNSNTDAVALLWEAQGLIVSVGMDPDFGDLPAGLTSSQEEASRLISKATRILEVDGCTCGLAWEGHPNPHAITCPMSAPTCLCPSDCGCRPVPGRTNVCGCRAHR